MADPRFKRNFQRSRFEEPIQGKYTPSEYDIDTPTLADEIARNVTPVNVVTIPWDGSTAQTVMHPIYGSCYQVDVNIPARGFRTEFYATGPQKPKDPSAFGFICFGDGQDSSLNFPAKVGRGFRGTFVKLRVLWPVANAISGSFLDLILFNSKCLPYMGGYNAQ